MTYIGVAVFLTMDISDIFLAVSSCREVRAETPARQMRQLRRRVLVAILFRLLRLRLDLLSPLSQSPNSVVGLARFQKHSASPESPHARYW